MSESLQPKRPCPRPVPSPEEIVARVAAWAEEMKYSSAYSREQYSRILGATLDAIENDHGDITPIEYFLTSILTKYASGAPTPTDLEWDWMTLKENFDHMVETTRNELGDMEAKLEEQQDYVQQFRNFAARYPAHVIAETEGTSAVTSNRLPSGYRRRRQHRKRETDNGLSDALSGVDI